MLQNIDSPLAVLEVDGVLFNDPKPQTSGGFLLFIMTGPTGNHSYFRATVPSIPEGTKTGTRVRAKGSFTLRPNPKERHHYRMDFQPVTVTYQPVGGEAIRDNFCF